MDELYYDRDTWFSSIEKTYPSPSGKTPCVVAIDIDGNHMGHYVPAHHQYYASQDLDVLNCRKAEELNGGTIKELHVWYEGHRVAIVPHSLVQIRDRCLVALGDVVIEHHHRVGTVKLSPSAQTVLTGSIAASQNAINTVVAAVNKHISAYHASAHPWFLTVESTTGECLAEREVEENSVVEGIDDYCFYVKGSNWLLDGKVASVSLWHLGKLVGKYICDPPYLFVNKGDYCQPYSARINKYFDPTTEPKPEPRCTCGNWVCYGKDSGLPHQDYCDLVRV